MIDTTEELFSAMQRRRIAVSVSDLSQPDQPLIYVNEPFTWLTGYTQEQCVGRNCRFLGDEKTELEAKAAIRDALEHKRRLEVFLTNRTREGAYFRNFLVLDFFEIGDAPYAIGCQFDATEKQEHVMREQRSNVIDMVQTAQDARIRAFRNQSTVIATTANTIALRHSIRRDRNARDCS